MTASIVHSTSTRLRLRFAAGDDPGRARSTVLQIAGVQSVRVARAARSMVVHFDGRAHTQRAIVAALRPTQLTSDALGDADEPQQLVADPPEATRGETLPVELSLLAAALTPALPRNARPPLALSLVAGKAFSAWRHGADISGTLLDAIALASTALTGHSLTATTSLLLGSLAERRRNAMLMNMDRLLARMAPVRNGRYALERAGVRHKLPPADLHAGDQLLLETGAFVPADGLVVGGSAEIAMLDPADAPGAAAARRPITRGDRIASGTWVHRGSIRIQLERPASISRAARVRDHVRHALRTRDAPGPLTPDLERLLAVPFTAAGLVLALTRDAGRTAAMLHADPEQGIAVAQPLAREAALYALARNGVLMSGLDSVDRLSNATTFAFQDVGVLADPHWFVDQLLLHDDAADEPQVHAWLAQLAGHRDSGLLTSGLPDEQVVAWREHGALLRSDGRLLHIGGALLLQRTWGIDLAEPDRSSLVRRLGIVDHGRLLATVHLVCRTRSDVFAQFAALRACGVRRIAVFTEDPATQAPQALTELGADEIVCRDRAAQERWLDEAVERGERVALVHTRLRDLLPPGGLSLCPVEAEAGAHGVLIGDVLPALLTARRAAMQIRRSLRRRFGISATVNSALMIAAAMRWLPPIGIAAIRHGLVFLLLQESAALARATLPVPRRQAKIKRSKAPQQKQWTEEELR